MVATLRCGWLLNNNLVKKGQLLNLSVKFLIGEYLALLQARTWLSRALVIRLRLHMADPCTKFEVSSVIRCGDITWGLKF